MQIIFLNYLLMAQKVYIFNYLFFVFCIFITNTVLSKTIIGIGLAIDGDTIHIGESKIRLHAIDAPEIKQTCKIGNEIWNCGHQSARKLKNLIKKNEIKCEVKDIDRYKRYVAECYLNNLKHCVRQCKIVLNNLYKLIFFVL